MGFVGFWKPGSLQHYLQTTGKHSEGERWQLPLCMERSSILLPWSLGPKHLRLTELGRHFGHTDSIDADRHSSRTATVSMDSVWWLTWWKSNGGEAKLDCKKQGSVQFYYTTPIKAHTRVKALSDPECLAGQRSTVIKLMIWIHYMNTRHCSIDETKWSSGCNKVGKNLWCLLICDL